MATEREPIGVLTTVSKTYYYEMLCGQVQTPHPAHRMAAAGSGGGGGAVVGGPLRGERTVANNMSEYWCPGIRGTMEV